MNAAYKSVNRPVFLSVREVAWALGIDQPAVRRAIRHGVLPLAKRRGRSVVPAAAIARLLCHTDPATDDGSDADGRLMSGSAS